VKPAPLNSNPACHEVIFMPCQPAFVHQEWRKVANATQGTGNAWMNPATGAAFNPNAQNLENGASVVACKEKHGSLSFVSFVTDFGE